MRQTKPVVDTNATSLVPTPQLLRREDAARSLSMSVDHFDDYVRPHVREIKLGRALFYSPEHLRDWVEQTAKVPPSPPVPVERLWG